MFVVAIHHLLAAINRLLRTNLEAFDEIYRSHHSLWHWHPGLANL